ncbi:hypothetical protein [Haloglomus litoreum]|uniref:hypothetical protein n=1 Tax=Haloglomus litoreum TaxID=3034026 RepID=UPI0023E7CEC2|nr:hypothetical protein [Haloglomus sp. DT116]
MHAKAEAALVSFTTVVLLGGSLWALLPTEPVAVAPYVPLVLAVAAVAGFLVAYGDRLFDPPQVTGTGPAEP